MDVKELTNRLVQLDVALQSIETEIADALDDGADLPTDAVERAEAFALERKENVNLVCDFLAYQEHEVGFLAERAAEMKLRADRAADLHKRFKDGLADRLRLREGAPRIDGVGKVHLRAQRNGSASLIFRNEDGTTATDDIVPDEYRVRHLTLTVPAAEESLKGLPQAVEAGKRAIIVMVPGEIADDVTEMVQGVVAFEGVDILTPAVSKVTGAESKAYPDNESLRKAIEEGKEVPGVSIEQGYHLRYSKITAADLAKSKKE